MKKETVAVPYVQMRRRDRAVEDETWICNLLHRAPIGVLATVHQEQPYINSNLFVFAEAKRIIYMHTARTGQTREHIKASEQVCFSVSEMGRLLPAQVAMEFSVEYSSVVILGTAEVVTDHTEAQYGLQLLLNKYFIHLQPGVDYRPITLEELARTSVYRIQIERWSGKKKAVEADFPGAFLYQPFTTTQENGWSL